MEKNKDLKGKDILADIFRNAEEHNDPKLNELFQFIENIADAFDSREQESTEPGDKKRKGPTKKRSSSYLSHENFEALDKAKLELQKLILEGSSGKISKSKITDISLEIILKDFKLNKENSILARQLKKYVLEKKKR